MDVRTRRDPGMIGLIHGRLLDLGQFDVTEMVLREANEAVGHAAANAGPFHVATIRPRRRLPICGRLGREAFAGDRLRADKVIAGGDTLWLPAVPDQRVAAFKG